MKWTLPKEGLYLPLKNQAIQGIQQKSYDMISPVSYWRFKSYPFQVVCNFHLRVTSESSMQFCTLCLFLLQRWAHFHDNGYFQHGILDFILRHDFEQGQILGHVALKRLASCPSLMHKSDSWQFIKTVNCINFPYSFFYTVIVKSCSWLHFLNSDCFPCPHKKKNNTVPVYVYSPELGSDPKLEEVGGGISVLHSSM